MLTAHAQLKQKTGKVVRRKRRTAIVLQAGSHGRPNLAEDQGGSETGGLPKTDSLGTLTARRRKPGREAAQGGSSFPVFISGK